jgi:hypothetical protein
LCDLYKGDPLGILSGVTGENGERERREELRRIGVKE